MRPRETATLKIRAVDYEGHPRSHLPVAVQAGAAELAHVETDSDGRATVTVPTSTRGDLTLKARAFDERGNEVVQQTSLWVTDGSFSDEELWLRGA